MVRVAVTAGPGRTALLRELAEDGTGRAAPVLVSDFPAAVAEYERVGTASATAVRWVWADTAESYPPLLQAGVRVDRCHDVALTGALLLARGGQPATPAGQQTAGQQTAVQQTAVQQTAVQQTAVRQTARQQTARQQTAGQQESLFGAAEPGFPETRARLDALIAAHADQLRRIARRPVSRPVRPARRGGVRGRPGRGRDAGPGHALAGRRARRRCWSACSARRPVTGLRPARLAALTSQISAALRRPPGQPRLAQRS